MNFDSFKRIAGTFISLSAACWLAGCGGAIKVPTSYKSWNAKDGTFCIDYPDGWEADGGGKQGVQWAKFKTGEALVAVNVDVSSSLVGDIIGTGTNNATGEGLSEAERAELALVTIVHKMKREAAKIDKGSGYKESDELLNFTSKLGDGRKSQFTLRQSLGSKLRGYRAIVLSNDRGINVISQCPEGNWKDLQPVFDKMLASLEYGQTQSSRSRDTTERVDGRMMSD